MKWKILILLFTFINGIAYSQNKSETKIEVIIKFVETPKIAFLNSKISITNSEVPVKMLIDYLNKGELKKLFYGIEDEVLDKMHTNAEQNLQKKVANLNTYFTYTCKDSSDHIQLSKLLTQSGVVETFYTPGKLYTATPGNYQPSQFYLDNAAAGINATNFWSTFNNRGTGIKVVDIEFGVNINHLDLPNITVLNTGTANSSNNDHGTSVCGEIASKNNGWGTTGIASDCQYYFAPTGSISYSIIYAANQINAGDFILIELQIAGPNCVNGCQSNPVGYVPVEWERATYDAIVNAVGNNRIIIEPAANGFQNLDDPIYSTGNGNHFPFLPANNSGAIMVGAGAATNGSSTPRSRLDFSNYGSRVDLQGIGERITTTGYGDLYSSEGVNYFYTSGFNGTSSASPIVTGAGILLQSKYKATTSNILNAATIKNALKATGKPQQNGTYPVSQNIGPLPDIVAAYNYVISSSSNCGTPTQLTSNTTCINYSSTVTGATASGLPIPNCNGSTSPTALDKWFSFVAQSTSETITVDPIGNTNSNAYLDAVIGLYSSCSGSGFIECYDETSPPGGGVTTTHTFSNLTIGNTYLIRVFDWGTTQPQFGGFDICIVHSPASSCTQPSSMSFNNITQTALTVTWPQVQNSISYTLNYRIIGGTWSSDLTTNNTFYNINNLLCSSIYEVRLRTNCSQSASTFIYAQFQTLNCSVTCNPPASMAFNSITQTGVSVVWPVNNNANNYNISYRISGGNWMQDIITSSTFYNFTGLSCNTPYEVRLSSNCSQSTSGYIYLQFQTLNCSVICNPPGSMALNNITQTGVSVVWPVVSNAINYNISYRISGGNWLPDVTTNNTFYNFSGLSCNTPYEVRINTNCFQSTSGYIFSQFQTLNCGVNCNPPGSMAFNNITQAGVNVVWPVVSNTNSYNISYRISGGTWMPDITTSNTFFNFSGLSCNTPYEVRISSNCSQSTSGYILSQFQTLNCNATCNPPGSMAFNNITQTGVSVVWPVVNNANSYNISYRITGGNWIPDITTSNTFFNFSGLSCNTPYEIRISSNCSPTTSFYTFSQFQTLNCPIPCNPPASMAFNNTSQTTVSVVWPTTSYATSYNVSIRNIGGSWNPDVTTSNTFYNFSGLTCNTPYEVRISSNCSPTSSFYTFSQFQTLSCNSPCNPIYALALNNITQSDLTLNWPFVANANSYTINVRDYGSTWSPDIITTNNYYYLTGLICNKHYEVRIKTNCNSSSSSYYITDFYTISCCPNSPPQLIYPYHYSTIFGNNIVFQWYKVPAATNYKFEISRDISFNIIDFETQNSSQFYTTGNVINIGLVNFSQDGTSYYWRVKAIGSSCSSSYSAVYKFFSSNCNFTGTPTPILYNPPNGSTQYTDRINFNWSDASCVNQTEFQVSQDPLFRPSSQIGVYISGYSSIGYYWPAFLQSGGLWYWRVRNQGWGGWGQWSNTFNFYTAGSTNNDSGFVRIYPNPNSGNFTVSMKYLQPGDYTIIIYDITGRLIESRKGNSNSSIFQEQFSLKNLPSGIYLVKVLQKEKSYVAKFNKSP